MQVIHQYDAINSKGYCYNMAEGAFKAFFGFRNTSAIRFPRRGVCAYLYNDFFFFAAFSRQIFFTMGLVLWIRVFTRSSGLDVSMDRSHLAASVIAFPPRYLHTDNRTRSVAHNTLMDNDHFAHLSAKHLLDVSLLNFPSVESSKGQGALGAVMRGSVQVI